MDRPGYLKWYGTQAWRRKAQRQLAKETLCRICRAQGRLEAARVADHVEDHKGNREKFWRGELQSLCIYHHNSKTRLDDAGRKSGKIRLQKGADTNGIPLDPRHPWRQEA
jgi:hypothetical protein